MVRILQLVSTLDKGSGVMNVLMNYNKNVINEGVVFDYLYFNESENSFKDEIISLGGKVIKFDKPTLGSKYKKYLNNIFLKLDYKYTTLHIHEVYLAFMFSPIAKNNNIGNVITHSHTTSYSDKLLSKIRNRILTHRIKHYADYYLSCSIAAGEFLYGKDFLKDPKALVLNNAIDTVKFSYSKQARERLRKEFNLENNYIIGHVGRFNKQKNHNFLIDIFYEAYKKDNNIKLILVGEGPLRRDIEDKVLKLGIKESVSFLGNRDDVTDLLSLFDILLMPSLFEGLPLVGVEAQSAGLPVIFSDKITKEVVFDNAIVNKLTDKASWIESIDNKPIVLNRELGKEIMNKNSFDIKMESIKLAKFYKSII